MFQEFLPKAIKYKDYNNPDPCPLASMDKAKPFFLIPFLIKKIYLNTFYFCKNLKLKFLYKF